MKTSDTRKEAERRTAHLHITALTHLRDAQLTYTSQHLHISETHSSLTLDTRYQGGSGGLA
jgi:hypothetical protein